MTKPVRIRFRKDYPNTDNPSFPKGAEVVITPGADKATELYGDAIDILSYEDGSPFEHTLKEQRESKREADDKAK